jgi:hypothetical protein
MAAMSKTRSAATAKATPKKARAAPKERLSLYPLNLETALGAAIATGPISPEDRKPKPKKKTRAGSAK